MEFSKKLFQPSKITLLLHMFIKDSPPPENQLVCPLLLTATKALLKSRKKHPNFPLSTELLILLEMLIEHG